MHKSLFQKLTFISFFVVTLLLTSCSTNNAEVDIYDSYAAFTKRIDFIYDSNFQLNTKKSQELLSYILDFEKDIKEYNEVNNSIFHSRLVSDS